MSIEIKTSNVFCQSTDSKLPSVPSNQITQKQLEEFRQMMIDDKVIVGCDEVIEMYEDEQGLLECLVFMWQQQSQKFRLNLPLPVREWFLSKFEKPNQNLVFYKGVHFKREDSAKLNSINASGSFIKSTTTDYEMAKDFAFGFDKCWLEDNHICCVYKVTGDLVFDVKPYRDFDEEEFIIYNPKFELLEVLN